MSIFRRESEAPPSPAAPQPSPAPARPNRAPAPQRPAAGPATRIASGTKVVGEISGSAELMIEGVVEGEIRLDSQVEVGPSGRVEGEIQARTVHVGGKVLGNVHGSERVEVLTSGSLEGDVISPRVVIAEGAFFKGKVEMTDKAARRPAEREAKTAAPTPAPPPAPAAPQSGAAKPAAPQSGEAKAAGPQSDAAAAGHGASRQANLSGVGKAAR